LNEPENPGSTTAGTAKMKRLRCAMRRGFTLVEVLVALAITSMLVSVLMSSLFYIFRVQEGLRDETLLRERQLRERAWVREALAACLPEEGENNPHFQGSRTELQCETSNALLPEKLPMTARIRMALIEEGDRTSLRYEESGGKTPVTLADWNGVSAEFRFIDAKGEAREQWQQGKEALPRQIWLLLTSVRMEDAGRREVWLTAVRADPWLPEKPALPPGMTWDMFKR
jgi:prepilin-type N-terminal cleavage/methylation domain-containing protein